MVHPGKAEARGAMQNYFGGGVAWQQKGPRVSQKRRLPHVAAAYALPATPAMRAVWPPT